MGEGGGCGGLGNGPQCHTPPSLFPPRAYATLLHRVSPPAHRSSPHASPQLLATGVVAVLFTFTYKISVALYVPLIAYSLFFVALQPFVPPSHPTVVIAHLARCRLAVSVLCCTCPLCVYLLLYFFVPPWPWVMVALVCNLPYLVDVALSPSEETYESGAIRNREKERRVTVDSYVRALGKDHGRSARNRAKRDPCPISIPGDAG